MCGVLPDTKETEARVAAGHAAKEIQHEYPTEFGKVKISGSIEAVMWQGGKNNGKKQGIFCAEYTKNALFLRK